MSVQARREDSFPWVLNQHAKDNRALDPIRQPHLNVVTISGNLAEDPTIRHTNSGVSVTNFRVVWNRQNGSISDENAKITCCISVAAWHWLAESCYQYLRKGNGVVVEGELQSKFWSNGNGENRNFIEIKARRVQFMNHHHGISEMIPGLDPAEETRLKPNRNATDTIYAQNNEI